MPPQAPTASGRLVAAADGSALGNPGPAGWAWYVDEDTWAAGGWPHGTNNMGELMAVLDLLRSSAHLDAEVHVLCDSTYVIKAVTEWMPGWKRRGWRKADGKPVLNQDLLRELDAALQGRRVGFEWVKGHAGHAMNEAADLRARAVATAYQQGTPPATGPGLARWTGELAGTPEAAADDAVPAAVLEDGAVRADPTPAGDTGTADRTTAGSARPTTAGPEEATLFPTPEPTDEEVVVALERELLDPRVRADPERLERLLHPHWREVGASGRLWSRAQIIEQLTRTSGPRATLEVVEVERVDAATMLLLWRSSGGATPALRSSLWKLGPSGWQQRYHQGTPES